MVPMHAGAQQDASNASSSSPAAAAMLEVRLGWHPLTVPPALLGAAAACRITGNRCDFSPLPG
jgi:hypothetical protein